MKLKTLYEEIKNNANLSKWFNGSKVSESGKPKIVYHGTTSNSIKVFDPAKIASNTGNEGHYGYGFYFSDDRTEASGYGSNIIEAYLKINKPFTGTDDEYRLLKKEDFGDIEDEIAKSIDFTSLKEAFSKVDSRISYFLELLKKYKADSLAWSTFKEKYGNVDFDLQDIYDIYHHTDADNADGVPDYIFEYLENYGIRNKVKVNMGFPIENSLHWITDLGNRGKDFTELIKKLGYDGVIYGSEYVVFEPTQIKSVENDGTFDSNDPNIYS